MKNQPITVKFPELHTGQLKIVKEIFNTDFFYYVLNCSRQSGKTFCLEWLMLYYTLKYPKNKNYFISPYYAQTKKSFNSILSALGNSNLIKRQSLTELEIELTNGSVMKFAGADNADALRGISPNFLFLDEFAFIKEDAWRMVIKPSLSVAGKKCFIASTPRIKGSDFHTMFTDGLISNKRYKSFHMTYKDNPLANLEEVNDAKQNLPEIIFKAEYLAEFIDSGGEVFQGLDEAAILPYPQYGLGETHYAAIDLGRVNDYTVLIIMDRNKNVKFMYRENQKDWQIIIDKLIKYLIEWKVKKCIVESNSVGDVVYDMLKKKLPGVIESEFTGSDKTNLIESLAIEFENKTIKLPKKELVPELYNELQLFSYVWNPKSRTLKYEAPQGKHDDTVMSLAYAIECVNKFSFHKPPMMYHIKNKK